MKIKQLSRYTNGDYKVTLYEDGTKIRKSYTDNPVADFPENIDLKITNKCDLGCPYCHENSTPCGKQGHFNYNFLWTLKRGTELAIGGGNIFEMCNKEVERENRDLSAFLTFCKTEKIIPSITVNQAHIDLTGLEEYSDKWYEISDNLDLLSKWIDRDLIQGIGISYNGNPNFMDNIIAYFEDNKEVFDINYLVEKTLKNKIVVHTIAGVHSYEDIQKLKGKVDKILVLGYKDLRRGHTYKDNKSEEIKKNIESLKKNFHQLIQNFEVVSFDNLAIEQLEIKGKLFKDEWEKYFMGEDGTHTMYIDLVEGEYARSSTSTERFKIEDDIKTMFKKVRR